MNIGQMDRRITLQAYVATRATNGEELQAWQDVATVAAERKYEKGTEQYQADQKQSVQRVVFRIRYRPGVTSLLRLVSDELTYQIDAVQEIGRRQGLLLNCFTYGAPAEYTPPIEAAAVPYTLPFTVA